MIVSRFTGSRAIARWAWRMFRRNWREQALVLVLLTVAVAVSAYGAALGHAVAPSDQASFGSATGRIRFSTSDPARAATTLSAARHDFGTVEEIADRSLPIPGSVRQLDLRTQDPHGAFAASTLRLRSGRYPTTDAEIALTSAMSQFLGAPVGADLTIGGAARRVVGLVENPAQLDDAFALVTTTPHRGQQIQYTLLVRASASRLAAFRSAMTVPGPVLLDRPTYYSHDLGVLLVAALGMMLVAVLALTAFLVLAQRRLRQLGMLAAVGATRRQVRNVTVCHGLIVGAIAAALGTAAAGATWALTGPVLALAAGKRLAWTAVPLWLILTPGMMAVLASGVAAWWPARTISRVPIVHALSNRPPEATGGGRSAGAAVLTLAIGAVCLRFAHQRNALLMITGLAAMIAAILLTAPLAIRAATRHSRLPIAGRLAWRELGRNQSRSAAALATVTMAVGISVAAVVVTAANTHPADAGNLSDRQVLIHATDTRDPALIPRRTPSQTAGLDSAVAQLAATMPHAEAIPLSLAVDPTATPSAAALASGDLDAVQIACQRGQQLRSYPLYLATPQLLAAFGASTALLEDPGLLAAEPAGRWSLLNAERERVPAPARIPVHGYSSPPQVLASPAMITDRHWQQARSGWLIQTPARLTAPQTAAARRVAAHLGLAVETRDRQTYLGRLQLMFTLGGIIVTLAIIAIALVLLRTQTTRDQQILTAVGAPRRARRALAATTATTLASLGTVIGIIGAYVTLLLAYSDTLNRLTNIPITALAIVSLGIPVLALLTTWLTSGRQPPSINRPVID